jgi:UTP--glucose-1-phosphate uridylyltransferase
VRYGFATGTEKAPGLMQIEHVVEKPGVGKIDSDYALVSGYLYEPVIFDAIEEAMKRLAAENSGRELVYVDALNILLEQKHTMYALEIENGTYYDCGNKLEYLKTVVEFGLRHPDTKDGFAAFIKSIS